MTMDRTAIEKILEQSKEQHDRLELELNSRKTAAPLVAVPNGFSIQDLEKHMPGRTQFRGKMVTSMTEPFRLYCDKHQSEIGLSACFVSDQKLSAVCILDLGDVGSPGHCRHRAELDIPYGPEFQALMGNVVDKRLSQRELAEWIEEWRDMLTFFASAEDVQAGKTMHISAAVSAIRSMEIENRNSGRTTEGNHASSVTVLEKQELKEAQNFPSFMCAELSPGDGLESRKFYIRFSVIQRRGEVPNIAAHLMRKQQILQLIQLEFYGLVNELLEETDIEVYQGSFSE